MIEPNDFCHFSVPPPYRANQNHDTNSSRLSPTLHATDKLLIGSHSVSMTDKLTLIINSEFVQTPHEAPAVERCPRFPAPAGAANSKLDCGASRPFPGSCSTPGEKDCTPIPEAGPCGFEFPKITVDA